MTKLQAFWFGVISGIVLILPYSQIFFGFAKYGQEGENPSSTLFWTLAFILIGIFVYKLSKDKSSKIIEKARVLFIFLISAGVIWGLVFYIIIRLILLLSGNPHKN